MNVLIVEPKNYENFYPISSTRPLWDMRCGCFKMYERIEEICKKYLGEDNNYIYYCRDELVNLYRKKYPNMKINEPISADEDLLILNGLLTEFPDVKELEPNSVYFKNETFVAAYIKEGHYPENGSAIEDFTENGFEAFQVEESQWKSPEYIWHMVLNNGKQIGEDYKILDKSGNKQSQYNVTFTGEESQIYIKEGCKIDPYVALDSTKGPIVIEANVEINPFTRIEGPCYIGKKTILLGAKVREGCTIGETCRIGGEVEDAIFHSYSNKYHDGFIGHAYIGEWVNLGALSTNSDLKNDYSTVKVYLPGGMVDSKETKVGSFIGDFTKTSIGSLMNTGASIGVGSMIVHSGRMTPPHTPDFTWFIKNQLREVNQLKELIDSSRKMMERRGETFTEEHGEMLERLFEETSKVRKETVKKWNETLK